MIEISKTEAEMIRKSNIEVHMRRTANRYYAEESPALLRFLGRGARRPNKGATSR